jgi:hypothetical protein
MKKQTQLKEEHVYLISNHSVAMNPMFDSEDLQHFFQNKMKKYLLPICDIMAYCLNAHEFQILVKTKSRQDFLNYFIAKKKGKVLEEDVPESTYIFSQAMANLQVSFVKHFNYINNRSGALIARRFNRVQINTEEEKKSWIHRLNAGVPAHRYNKKWAYKSGVKVQPMSSNLFYKYDLSAQEFKKGGLVNGFKFNLVGRFNIPLVRSDSQQNSTTLPQKSPPQNQNNPKTK